MKKVNALVLPVEGRMVMEESALKAGFRRYVGYDWNASSKQWDIDYSEQEIVLSSYYMKAIQNGDLELIATE